MMPRFETVWVFAACVFAPAAAPLHVAAKPVAVPSTTRELVHDKVENGYRLKIIQVLLHVRPVAPAELDEFAAALGQLRSGQFVGKLGIRLSTAL